MAWGHTVNHPDLVDIYELEMDPEDPLRYRVDDQWYELEQTFSCWKFVYGERFDGKSKGGAAQPLRSCLACGGSCACYPLCRHDSFRQLEQWFWMAQSTDLVSFKKAMRRRAMFNTGYADKEGNVFYAYNALLPNRAPSHDWQSILPETPERLSGRITCLSMSCLR